MTVSVPLTRPQPVGILPIPAGLLVLPDAGFQALPLLEQCMQGKLPAEQPAEWNFYLNAARGDMAQALLQIEAENTPEARYNKFVLDPAVHRLADLRATLTGELRVLLEVAAYTSGLADEVPAAGELDAELLALVLMTQAAAAIESESIGEAIALLEQAVEAARPVSPVFTAHLLAQLASLCRTQPEPLHAQARQYYRQAIDVLGGAATAEVLGDLWMQLGIVCQENAQGRESWMAEAVEAYQQVLRGGLVAEDHRELFALAHNNLGLLFLTMPMTEAGKHLRMGVAVQSFREGLRLCDREASPELWASIQSNLANALQYLPTSHPEENLAQAVELYEELVHVGRKAFDPVGYGKILSNQANALAHLGIFSPALEKLQEARKLFEWHNETELAATAMEMVTEIHEQLGRHAGAASGSN